MHDKSAGLGRAKWCDSHKGLKHLPHACPSYLCVQALVCTHHLAAARHVAKNVHLKIGVRGGLEGNGHVRKHVLLNLQA